MCLQKNPPSLFFSLANQCTIDTNLRCKLKQSYNFLIPRCTFEELFMSADCFLKNTEGEKCGPSSGVSGEVRLEECNDKIENHLISCYLSKESLKWELILARAGLFNLPRENVKKNVDLLQASPLPGKGFGEVS